jgi:Xaa-Pro aminopeptidase
MNEAKQKLLRAEQQSKALFDAVEQQGLIVPGKTELELANDVAKLARDHFGITEHWHKKIVRSGMNTLCSYSENPPDLLIQKDDILFLDFGPIFEGWEADVGKTFVLGDDPLKHKLKRDVEAAWREAKAWHKLQTKITGAEYFHYIVELTRRYGWEFGGEIAGHIVGHYPHEQPEGGGWGLDVHPDNHDDILQKDNQGNPRHWILELQFVDRKNGIGAYIEQLL